VGAVPMTMWGHGRWRQRVALLAYGALAGAERTAAEAHVQACARCGRELEELTRVRAVIDAEVMPEMPLPMGALEARVRARLAEAEAAPAPAGALRPSTWRLAAPLAAAAVVAVGAWAVLRTPAGPTASPSLAPETVAEAETAAGSAQDEMLRRMERVLAREQAARYLNEAQDVLVTVTAGPSPCPKGMARVEVEDDARERSRALLARRASLAGPADVASAEPVLAEVEQMLREVADLPSCVRKGRLQALQREVGRRRLLMKIDLMTRELQG